MHWKFFGAFASKDEFIGLDIVNNLAKVSKLLGDNSFTAVVKVKGAELDESVQVAQQHFTQDFLEQHIKPKEDVNTLYPLCGPPRFNSEVYAALIRLGTTPDSIFFV
eukprot:TRINITY_DN3147_c0_g1_i1.p1 TRINITY_DN3147_c0_g1~~TRINITY_DN3147_c0_g1_i1.p1  ORF type:complete len:107 (-),score=36.29 TRINITY_DN3147_c0_g1_i1:143-463(-)